MRKTRILFDGHDLKFLHHVIEHFSMRTDFEVRVHTNAGHNITDTETVSAMLPETDVIFCEWGLGNLAWYSGNKLPGQLLVVRIHAQEIYKQFLADTNWENINRIIFVSGHMMRKFLELHPETKDKCMVIHNLVDGEHFNREKTGDAVFHLGMVGILPKLKAPHRALQLLRELRETDDRFQLFIKSRKPEELAWLMQRKEERDYYERFLAMIGEMGLSGAVSWDPHGDNVAEWFQQVGFILSCSDRESFHVAVAEGMASGAVPVIFNWEGAAELYPGKYICSGTAEAAQLIRSYAAPERFVPAISEVRKYVADRFPVNDILGTFDKILVYHEPDPDEIRRAYLEMRSTVEEMKIKVRQLEEENAPLKTKENQLLHAIIELTGERNDYRKRYNESDFRLRAILNSVSWKTGSALIRKPADFLKRLTRLMKRS